MRKLFYLMLLLLPLSAATQTIDSAWVTNHYAKKEIYIAMRDKAKLFTAIYLPVDSNRQTHPILLLRTPYSCAPYGKQWIPFWKVYVKDYLKEGYIVVFQDVRGKYRSEGHFVNIRPFNPNKKTNKDIDEASDAYDTIDWLVKNVHGNNGRVGSIGTSYGGFYTTMAGLSGHPALKAISPQAPVTEWFLGDDAHHNGAFMLMDMFNFYVASGFGSPRPDPTAVAADELPITTADAYEYFLGIGPLPNFTRIAVKRKAAFWSDLMEHRNYDTWWKARNNMNYSGRIPAGTASLVVGGLFDAEDCFGAINLYHAIEAKSKNNNKFVFGPWRHGQWGSGDGTKLGDIKFGSNTSEWYVNNIEVPFFNFYLKGEGTAKSIAEATVFFTGENKWRKLKQWPVPNLRHTDLYFKKGSTLSFTKPKVAKEYTQYISDPAKPVLYMGGIHKKRPPEYMVADQRFAASRPDVISFTTTVLDKDLTLAGPVGVDLYVSISTTDADFVVKLIDVFPDSLPHTRGDTSTMNSYQMLVRGDIFRGRYRKSFSKPEPFSPGEITNVKYTLNDIAHTFKKGHKIMVQVQSSWFPIADRNPQQFINIYRAKKKDFIKSTIRVYMQANAASKLILPVITRE